VQHGAHVAQIHLMFNHGYGMPRQSTNVNIIRRPRTQLIES
jgi:hypothetical protein